MVEDQDNKKREGIRTYTVPFSLDEIKKDIFITAKSPTNNRKKSQENRLDSQVKNLQVEKYKKTVEIAFKLHSFCVYF